MAEITATIETFYCDACGYRMDINQHPDHPRRDPYTEGFLLEKFPEAVVEVAGIGFMPIQPGECPSCFMRGVFPTPKLAREIRPEMLATMYVKNPDTLSEEVKTEQVGIDEETGDPVVQEVELTQQEREAMAEKISHDLERLSLMEYDPRQVA